MRAVSSNLWVLKTQYLCHGVLIMALEITFDPIVSAFVPFCWDTWLLLGFIIVLFCFVTTTGYDPKTLLEIVSYWKCIRLTVPFSLLTFENK